MKPPLVLIHPATFRAMLRDRQLFGLLVGAAIALTGAAAFGWWFELAPVAPHRTLPRPVWDQPAPADLDPLEHRIPAQRLPTK